MLHQGIAQHRGAKKGISPFEPWDDLRSPASAGRAPRNDSRRRQSCGALRALHVFPVLFVTVRRCAGLSRSEGRVSFFCYERNHG